VVAQPELLAPIAATGVVVAFLHAAIPTHWLPFVLAARGQGWSRARTLGVVALAGTGHVLLTALLGALLVFAGVEAGGTLGRTFGWLAGGALIAVGAFYLWRQARGAGHGHVHLFGRGDHGHQHGHGGHAHDASHHHDPHHGAPRSGARRRSDVAVIAGLFALLTLSPCEGFLPVYGAGIVFGWAGFVLLSCVLAVATVAAMGLFTWLTLTGLEGFDLSRIARWEAGVYGVLFIGLGLLVLVNEGWS
jgi:nickel/cobalt exporter